MDNSVERRIRLSEYLKIRSAELPDTRVKLVSNFWEVTSIQDSSSIFTTWIVLPPRSRLPTTFTFLSSY